MALDPATFINILGVYPDVVGVNASGPATQDGFEFVANYVNNYNLGVQQMLLNHAGLTPNGVVESDTNSQVKEALQKGFGAPPGVPTEWHLALDPGVTGHRCLPLNGQGVLRTSFPDLDAATYVGDGNNAAVSAASGAYYHADDAAGTIPNIAGIYLILPESRGIVPRGLDAAGSIDPDGASRFLGDLQEDALQGHWHEQYVGDTDINAPGSSNGIRTQSVPTAKTDNDGFVRDALTDGVNGTPRIDVETRAYNRSTNFVVWY